MPVPVQVRKDTHAASDVKCPAAQAPREEAAADRPSEETVESG